MSYADNVVSSIFALDDCDDFGGGDGPPTTTDDDDDADAAHGGGWTDWRATTMAGWNANSDRAYRCWVRREDKSPLTEMARRMN